MSFIYATCKNKREAETIAMMLIKKRLIACANIFPIKSLYWWKGTIQRSHEQVIFAKTIKKNFKSIQLEVLKLHSYTVPCISLIDSTANKDFEQWVKKE